MRPYIYIIPFLLFVLFFSSCRKDFEYGPSNGNLEFSKDTVFLDTIFTNIGSATYTLKVYNTTRDDVEIPSLRLGQGQNSNYRLNVDGVAGKEFTNIPLLAQDSLFIFVETTFDIGPLDVEEFLYTDAIIFDAGIYEQQVQLVTLVRDAIFLYPPTLPDGSRQTLLLGLDAQGNEIREPGFVLQDSVLNFSNEKPYVIYGYAAVPQDKTLTIAAGARIHFHNASGIFVDDGATLKVNGQLSTDRDLLEKEVIFQGDRLEQAFAEIPGQWGIIWLAEGSRENELEYLTIKNATLGLRVEGNPLSDPPKLTIKNTQIYNSATVNLWGINTHIRGENLVLGSAGNASLHCNSGGYYDFKHCTIANYWSNGFRTSQALRIDTFGFNGGAGQDLLQASFTNCIVYGNTARELSLLVETETVFNFEFINCLLRFQDTGGQFTGNPLYEFDDSTFYQNIQLNENPEFLDTSKWDFRIGSNTPAGGMGDPAAAALVPLDILGTDRTSQPDLGAYQQLPSN